METGNLYVVEPSVFDWESFVIANAHLLKFCFQCIIHHFVIIFLLL